MSTTSTITRPKPAEPATLDHGMTPGDIIDVLQWIQFPKRGRPVLVEIDEGVRDFIVDALRTRSPAFARGAPGAR
jgi:hypothetical protein